MLYYRINWVPFLRKLLADASRNLLVFRSIFFLKFNLLRTMVFTHMKHVHYFILMSKYISYDYDFFLGFCSMLVELIFNSVFINIRHIKEYIKLRLIHRNNNANNQGFVLYTHPVASTLIIIQTTYLQYISMKSLHIGFEGI